MNNGKIKIGGIILSGGKSSRMGTDKGLMNFNGKPLIQYSIDLLSTFCAETIISANDAAYEQFGLLIVKDEYPNCGPISGLHAALKASNYEWNLVVGCDTPFLQPELLENLLREKEGYEAVIPTHQHGTEPLIGLYHKSLASFFEKKILEKHYIIQKALKECNTKYLHVDPILTKYPKLFCNLNSQTDIIDSDKIK